MTTTEDREHLGRLARIVLEATDRTLYGVVRHRARRSGAFVVDLFCHDGHRLVNLRPLCIAAGYPLHRTIGGVSVYEQGTDPVALVGHDVLWDVSVRTAPESRSPITWHDETFATYAVREV